MLHPLQFVIQNAKTENDDRGDEVDCSRQNCELEDEHNTNCDQDDQAELVLEFRCSLKKVFDHDCSLMDETEAAQRRPGILP